jgi:hypothetical protein
VINEGFECEHCGQVNSPAAGTCRNHCISCLYSKHLDKLNPGDRLASCLGLMKPVQVIGSIDNLQIIHQCEKCNKQIINKKAPDDDFSAILELQSREL